MTDPQYPQIYLSSSQMAHRMVQEYTKKEVFEKAEIRHVPSELPVRTQRILLEKIIAEEKYILEVSNLTLYPRKKLENLAKKLHINHGESYDSVHLAWEIALIIVRDKIGYKFNNQRQLMILKHRK
jgi:hypothetical protein